MLTVQLTEADLVAAQIAHSRDSRWMPAIGVLLALLGAGILLFGLDGSQPWGISALLAGVFALAQRFIVVPRRMKRIYRQRKNFQRPQEVSWTGQALIMTGSFGSVTSPWSDFLKWREGPSVFLVYMSEVQFHIIPKRAFSGEGEEEFRTLLISVIGRADKPRLLPARRTLLLIIGLLAVLMLLNYAQALLPAMP